MLTLFAVLGALIVGGGGMAAIAHVRNRSLDDDGHKHIWSPWEDCDLQKTYGPVMEPKTRLVPGQKRDCLNCGYREVKELKP